MNTPPLSITPIPILKDNYVWTFIDKSKNLAVIIDPGEAVPVRDYLQQTGLTLAGILITHHHWDHTNGILDLTKIYDVPVFGPAEKIKGVTHIVNDKTPVDLDFLGLNFSVMAIPGHTLGHVAYYAPGMIFCGDTLFASGCGRIFEGTPAQMYQSLQKIAALPPDTKVYCAHEYTLNNLRFATLVEPDNKDIIARLALVKNLRDKNTPTLPSTLADEKATNPFLRCENEAVILSVQKKFGTNIKDPIQVFAHLREWKDHF